MAYDFDARPFNLLAMEMSDYPEGIPGDRETLERLARVYLGALEAQLDLMRRIMEARLAETRSGRRYATFLPLYRDLVRSLLAEMTDHLQGSLEGGDSAGVQDFLEGTRRGAIPGELAALGQAIAESSGMGEDAAADEAAGTTVTNSLKEQIERRVRRKWIKDILHGLNEILAVARGAS